MSKSNKPRYSRRAEPTRVNDILCWEQAAHDAPVIVHWRNGETCVSRCYMSIDYVLAHEHAKEVFDHLPAEATECAPELPQPCVPAAKKLVYEAMTYAPPAEASVPAPQIRYGVREPDGTRTVIVEDEAPAPQSAPQGEVKTFMEDDSRCQSTIRAIVERVMMRLGADHADFRLRDELIVLAAPYLHKHERTVAELLEEVERLKDPDKYSVPHDVQERIKELRTELSERKATARRAAQMLIEEVGAQGPENVDETAVRTVNKIKAMRERADELTARAEAAEAERDAIRVQWQSLSDEREEERAALRRRGIRFVKVGGILEAIIPIDEPKAYTPTKPGELDRLLHEAHAESLTPATVNDAAKIEAFTHTEWKRGTKDGCGGELRPHLIELVRKSDYDALQGRCEALTKECDEWKAEAERCGQFELRQVEEREAIKRAVGFEENGPSLPEWCAKIARNLASEEAACSQLIDERDGAQDAADHLASNILGEPIDWSFHAEKWNEAREAALALRTQLAEANKRCDELTEHERQTHERLGAILGMDDSLEECSKRLKAENDAFRACVKAFGAEGEGAEQLADRVKSALSVGNDFAQLWTERDDLRAKLEQAEAGAAAMREALSNHLERMPRLVRVALNARQKSREEFAKNEMNAIESAATSALDGTAGRDLLAKVKTLEARVEKYEADGAEYRELALAWERKCGSLVAALEDYNHAVELVVYRDSIDQAKAPLADAKEPT